jgi:CHAT domain-containing protein/predicted negative regulator of RcsB-dependent stress response
LTNGRQKMCKFSIRRGIALCCLNVLLTGILFPQSFQDQVIDSGKTIEREIGAGSVHSYSIGIKPDQLLHLSLNQIGADVSLTLFGVNGSKIIESNSNPSPMGPERIIVVTEGEGFYKLNVQSLNKTDSGRYQLKIEEHRAANELDKNRVIAQRIFTEAKNLCTKGNLESIRACIQKYEEALPYWRKGEDSNGEAKTLNNLGNAYNNIGENLIAIDYYLKALPAYKLSNNKKGEVGVLTNIGLIYNLFGENQKAFDCFNQALLTLTTLTDQLKLEADTLINTGTVLKALGEKASALENFNKALSSYKKLKDKHGEASALGNIGSIYTQLADYTKALDYYNKALEIFNEWNNKKSQARTLQLIGNIYGHLGKDKEALKKYEEALLIFQSIIDRQWEAAALNDMGELYRKTGEYEKALGKFDEALQISRSIMDRTREAEIRLSIARTLADLNRLAEAVPEVEKAIEVIETMRSNIDSSELRSSYLSSVQAYYEFYINLLMKLGKQNPLKEYNKTALHIAERAKARSLIELLYQSGIDIQKGVPTELLEQEKRLQQQLASSSQRQIDLLSKKFKGEEIQKVSKEIKIYTSQLFELQSKIRRSNPHYAAIKYPEPLDYKEIQKLVDSETILLEYFLGKPNSYLWMVTESTVDWYELPSSDEIEKAARKVYENLIARTVHTNTISLETRQANILKADVEFQKAAASLSQIILGPVANQLGSKRLLIIGDGALQYLPFTALPEPTITGNNKNTLPLITKHEVINLPSASTLSVLRARKTSGEAATKKVAIFADPVFNEEDQRVTLKRIESSVTTSNHKSPHSSVGIIRTQSQPRLMSGVNFSLLPRLEYTKELAETIIALTHSGEWMKAIGFDANKTKAMSDELSQYKIVIFATHGLLDSEHPERSGLLLSMVDKEGNPQKGFLQLQDVYNMNLQSDLVVLAACESGLGKEIKGEGLIGLTRGFMYAGASRVIASLWKVDEQATVELIKRFYEKIEKGGLTPVAALKEAQTSLMKQKKWKHPYYWAGFTLQGEWK